ncbi:kinase-like protein [Rhizophagus irregularis]|uniref:Kinase-like protein n=1 Tax=Rhizophagus irregularis TaxID=588596 RepID=A0A2N0PBF1_9GLOM|nr:kinase-like protein [Rhizophagus irregularis]
MDDTDNKWIQWIKNGIANKSINYYDYSEFQNIKCIGNGGFGNVYQANWNSSNTVIALKSLLNGDNITKEIINEIRLMQKVNFHKNIIQLFGITSNTNDVDTNNYLFVLEYADSGTLKNYLKNNFNKLDWNIKLRFAIQIANVVSCIHQKDIVHNDLNSDNILVHRNIIKLADFGLSRRAGVSNSVKEKIPYIDPQRLKNQIINNNKKSDVYSVGVLLWEISSGQKPFNSYDNSCDQISLTLNILEGKREIPIIGTPDDYINIYTRCWQDNPYDRPDIHQVFSDLINLNINENISYSINFDEFIPLIDKFIKFGEEILILYEKSRHNKELCGFLLNRCNCAMASIRDLKIRKTENTKFFSKKNLKLFKEFIKCMERIRKFVSRISKFHKLLKYFIASNIEQDFNDLVTEFDGYMRNLNFSFVVQSKDEISKMRNEIRQIKDILLNIYGVPDDKQALIEFSNRMDQLIMKNINLQKSARHVIEDSSEIETNEPLLDGEKYQRLYIHTKKIEKRTLYSTCEEFCFNEILPDLYHQIEIRREVNILKGLKGSDHIIRFFGVAHEESKFYLITEWMEYGNLHVYYTNYREMIDWNAKIKFALDICSGVAYLHECKILHHDIRSTNILVNRDHKVKIAYFGLSKNFPVHCRNIANNLDITRYMAPEKFVGVLLWEIAELNKPHSDLNEMDMLASIRKRVSERYSLPFSNDVPIEWRFIVARATEYEPSWRPNISDICRDLYNLSKNYQLKSTSYDSNLQCAVSFPESFDKPMLIDDDDDSSSNQNNIQNID